MSSTETTIPSTASNLANSSSTPQSAVLPKSPDPTTAWRYLHAITHSSPAIMYSWQPKRTPKLVFLNDRVETITGSPTQAFVEDNAFWRSRIHRQDRTAVRETVHNALTKGFARCNYRFHTIDGRVLWLDMHLVATADEKGRTELLGFELDITQAVNNQEALRQEHRLLHTLISTGDIAVAFINRHGETVYANEPAMQLPGLIHSHNQSKPNAQFSHHAQQPNTISPLPTPSPHQLTDWDGQPIAAEQTPYQRVCRTRQALKNIEIATTTTAPSTTGDKTSTHHRRLKVNASPILDTAGEIETVVLSAQDVTTQYNTYEELAKSESRYRRLIESQLDLVCRYQTNGQLTFANTAFLKLIDQKLPNILSQDFNQVLQIDPTAPTYKNVPAGGSYTHEHIYEDRQKQQRHIQWVHRSILNSAGKPVEYLAVGRDMTPHRVAERELQRVKDRLSLIIESCPAVFYTCKPDPPFDLTMISERNQQLTGYSPEEFTNPPERWQGLIHPDDLQIVFEEMLRARTNGHGRVEFRLKHKNGDYRWLQKECVFLYDADKKPIDVVGFVADITDQKVSEQVLRESREHYRALAKNNQRLLSEVNHRVRNNLSSLTSLIHIAENKPASHTDTLPRLKTRIRAMARLHNLLADTNWQNIDLSKLIADILSLPDLLNKHTLKTIVHGPTVKLHPRAAQPLAMSLTELVTNAAKHGAGTVTEQQAVTTPPQIDIHWQVEIEPPSPLSNDTDHHSHHHLQHNTHPTHPTHTTWLHLHWHEQGGPPPKATITPGTGTQLITGFIQYELGGQCDFNFTPQGVRHTLKIPLESDPFFPTR